MIVVGLALAGCSGVEKPPVAETRPVGEPVLSDKQLREAKVAVSFTDHVKPILEERCLYCHNGRELPGKLDLRTRASAMAPGPFGPRILPGKGEESLLISFISTGNHAMSMPAVGTRVAPEEVEVLTRWIDQGATWPEGTAGTLTGR